MEPETLGVRWSGPLFDWSSYAALARGFVWSLQELGATVAIEPAHAVEGPSISELSPRPGDFARWLRMMACEDELPRVYCGFPVAHDGLDVARLYSQRAAEHLPCVCFTMFETDTLPSPWIPVLADLDAVWVPSTFNRATFIAAGVPAELVQVVQPGVVVPPAEAIRGRPASVAAFTFLSVFAWQARKGWDLLLDAFVAEFGADPTVQLVVKTTPGDRVGRELDGHLAELGGDREAFGIRVITDMLSRAELDRLYADADAFVLPTRGEGWGLPCLEALAWQLPVIATRWSGVLDYLDDSNSFLVDIDGLVEVPADFAAEHWFFGGGQRWAEPSPAHLRARMRQVVDDAGEAAARAQRGRADVESKWTTHHAADRLAAALTSVIERGVRRPAFEYTAGFASLRWLGLVYGANSFSVEGRDLVLALAERGVAIALEPAPGPGQPLELTQAESQVLSRQRATRVAATHLAVLHSTPTTMEPVEGATVQVARTMFETEDLLPDWVRRCNGFDENWVPSNWCAERFVASGVDEGRVHVVPESVPSEFFEPAEPLELGHRGSGAFLAIFDWQLRKGWDVLVRAYSRAFSGADDVVLYLLAGSILRYRRAEMERAVSDTVRQVVRAKAANLQRPPRIVFLDGPIPAADMPRLFAAVDAYVLPTRGEGWGRPFAAAMATGTLAIATDRGGQTHFMNDHNSLLIDSRIVPVSERAATERPIYAGHRWSEPDEDHLVELLGFALAGDHHDRIATARRDIEAFRRERIAELIETRAAQLLGRPLLRLDR